MLRRGGAGKRGGARPSVLYISYDGMLEPLGESQVIAYLEKLSDAYDFHLLSFEKPADWKDVRRRKALAARLARSGIAWHPMRYHKAPTVPATAYDVARGTAVALALAFRHRIRLVHARSYLPAWMGLQVRRATGARLLFDMRGFWGDERVDAGIWARDGRIYRAVKRLERLLFARADAVVTLTHASVEVIRQLPEMPAATPIAVIPTCTDLDRFAPSPGPPPATFTLGYVGSAGTWYLFDEALLCFRLIADRRPGARLLIVNRGEHDFIRARLAAIGVDPAAVDLVASDHASVPGHIARMSAGAAIITPVRSKIASAPTKLGEYLGCGIPCLGNVDVGDMEAILEGEGVGVALSDYSDAGRAAAVDRLIALAEDPATAARCRAVAERLFSLDVGAAGYRALYAALIR